MAAGQICTCVDCVAERICHVLFPALELAIASNQGATMEAVHFALGSLLASTFQQIETDSERLILLEKHVSSMVQTVNEMMIVPPERILHS